MSKRKYGTQLHRSNKEEDPRPYEDLINAIIVQAVNDLDSNNIRNKNSAWELFIYDYMGLGNDLIQYIMKEKGLYKEYIERKNKIL